MNAKSCAMMLAMVAGAIGLTAAADNYYWDATEPQPASWNSVGSWKIGGNSQYDPDATSIPTQAGQDEIYFRDPGPYVVGADAGVVTNDYWILRATQGAKVDFNPPATTVFYGLFNELASGTAFGFHSGTLYMPAREFYVNSAATVTFEGPNTTLTGGEPFAYPNSDNNHNSDSYLRFNMFHGNCAMYLTNGVTVSHVRVNAGTYNDGDNVGEVLKLDGARVDDFVVAGAYVNSEITISNSTVNGLLLQNRDGLKFIDEYPPTGSVFSVANSTVSNLIFRRWYSEPHYRYQFGPGAHVSLWPGEFYGIPDAYATLDFGDGTYSNMVLRLGANEQVMTVKDGAQFQCKAFSVGYGASNQVARVTGAGTYWSVEPDDQDLQAILTVGQNEGGRPGCGNVMIVEDGARMHFRTDLNQRNSYRLTMPFVGLTPGDNDNAFYIRSGSVVTNDGWTGVGGAFLSSGGDGGDHNLFCVSNATYVGGAAYNDIWDATLFVGGMIGGYNTFEVVDGGFAEIHGKATLSRGPYSGGNVIRCRDGRIWVRGAIDVPSDGTHEKGTNRLEIAGVSGRVSVRVVERVNGAADRDPLVVAFGVTAPRTVDEPFLEIREAYQNFDSSMQKGYIVPELSIDRRFAHAGKGVSAVLVTIPNNPGNPGTVENALKALNSQINPAAIRPCTTEVRFNSDLARWELVLKAGSADGLAILFK